VTTKDPTKP